ncbi:hypothetical protein GXY_05471 [Novacetimonas hansenii ATCC 23769]|uniref:Uncharacterized protein n=1 Tax=Novacetimonas hansenii ATCC 23769 TaxID=714995 RepID=D5QD88_NOVHA|nr:hypothetical protein GXY_05471 [Novacetimonas hansenii ATCC 23769]
MAVLFENSVRDRRIFLKCGVGELLLLFSMRYFETVSNG